MSATSNSPNPAPSSNSGAASPAAARRRDAGMPPAIRRLAYMFIAATCFFTIATFNKPRTSAADTARIHRDTPAAPGAAAQAAPQQDEHGRSLIGSLSGRDTQLWIYSSPAGPLYTVLDAHGKVLARGLTTDQVYEQFPDLHIHELHFTGDPKQIMIVDPRN